LNDFGNAFVDPSAVSCPALHQAAAAKRLAAAAQIGPMVSPESSGCEISPLEMTLSKKLGYT